jgi:predicted methyltransferase
MRKLTTAAALLTLAVAVPAGAQDAAPSAAVTASVADAQRPAADKARDSARKPAQVVAFAGVKPGDVVAELLPGGGYYTRILAGTVGPQGHVYAVVPPAFAQRPGGLDSLNALAQQYGNITVVTADLADLSLPAPADLVWTTENYHDLHNGPSANVAGVNAAVFQALKPGGIYFVEDHSAAPGSGTSATQTLHRIDPAAVKTEVEAAGFTFDAESSVLANPADPKTVGVRDPSLQGGTDKFAIRFRKPG